MGSALFLQLSTNTSQLVREQIFGYRHTTSSMCGVSVLLDSKGKRKETNDDDDGAKETTK